MTPKTLKLFTALAADADNWGGETLLDGNVPIGPSEKGNLTDLKKQGLIQTYSEDGDTWCIFTEAGKQLAAELGHPIH